MKPWPECTKYAYHYVQILHNMAIQLWQIPCPIAWAKQKKKLLLGIPMPKVLYPDGQKECKSEQIVNWNYAIIFDILIDVYFISF